MRTVVATVVCGRCQDEKRAAPGILGTVERHGGSGPHWYYRDRRHRPMPVPPPQGLDRLKAFFGDDVITLGSFGSVLPWQLRRTSGEGWVHDIDHPRTVSALPAYCRYHGVGSIPTSDVIAARGNVALIHSATR